jgi:hypothetical protein
MFGYSMIFSAFRYKMDNTISLSASLSTQHMQSETIRLDIPYYRILSFDQKKPDDTHNMWAHWDLQACPLPITKHKKNI